MNNSSYKDLIIWRRSMEVGLSLYKELKKFPQYEQYALCDQIRRCLISIPSNIAEGHARNSKKEFMHFLSISRGSLAEVQTQIIFCIELGYLSKEFGEQKSFEFNGIDIMIRKYMDTLNKNNPNIFKSLKSLFLSFFV